MRTIQDTREERAASQKRKRPYEPPQILSSEPLEAAAATCDGKGTGGFGKSVPTCSPARLGS